MVPERSCLVKGLFHTGYKLFQPGPLKAGSGAMKKRGLQPNLCGPCFLALRALRDGKKEGIKVPHKPHKPKLYQAASQIYNTS